MTTPVSARAAARQLGIGVDALLRRYRDGKFKAVIDDGRMLRFDVETVRKALSKPAKRTPRGSNKSGMIPTY